MWSCWSLQLLRLLLVRGRVVAQHCDLHKSAVTGCSEQLFQLNPVGMGTDEEVGFAMEAPKL